MDTRQLAAFCAVVERRSFSQAAERLGRDAARGQPADPGAREAARDEAPRPLGPPRRADRGRDAALPRRAAAARARGAGRRRGRRGGDGRARGPVRDRGLDRARAGSCSRSSSASSARCTPSSTSLLSVFDTQTIVERVAARELELGVVGAARRHRGVVFEPFFHDEVILACPPGPPVRRADGHARRGARGRADRDAGGRRRPADDRGRAAAARACGCATSTSGSSSACRSRSRARCAPGYGVTFISRTSVESDLAAGTLAEARVEGLELRREIYLVRAAGRAETRAAARSSSSPASACA